MKKIISALLTVCFLSGATAIVVNAQGISSASGEKKFIVTDIEINSKEKISPEEVNVKAVRDFEKSFKQVQKVNWYKVKDGFMVYFYQEGNKKISGYDPKGNWIYNLVSYPEEKLPRQVWLQVKSVYSKSSITWVNEIQKSDKTIYVVHLEDKDSYKNVRVCDDEMDVIEEIKKS